MRVICDSSLQVPESVLKVPNSSAQVLDAVMKLFCVCQDKSNDEVINRGASIVGMTGPYRFFRPEAKEP
jgi:hypothetical protein